MGTMSFVSVLEGKSLAILLHSHSCCNGPQIPFFFQICAETVVGDAMLRGISGGQKKRVTTAEMVVGPKKTLFLDEISTGLVFLSVSLHSPQAKVVKLHILCFVFANAVQT